ncbi:related to aerobactin biosynthesis protein iucB (epsilon-hydroxylysine:acetyl coenzyme A N epsilon-transacetylase) [Ramularia collo-cygni]|uniref:Related to aerobactin biosynthesis protein iucB (Epsilon-hydroxylysine:acetyl coenzyme A N epsilon-transacetylase) n=1 Tax=Ramularia collo-cygni TaxID=112498 RepID=A0A2D3UZ23_9PEZI|nr:related to aerobactin biosynthesis protein iucB (epsilon-hydroxylysine:acetyl coenzyme A N epsilon-transacetylase) [Ramularia collo-cygni]CZT20728.1 related to aerobactin biosynthesis protein iucB (epsilon-hydroxylysine:acetyl coenzyme A N epsilon-transacetylase) [Ramularia collo-cygni]
MAPTSTVSLPNGQVLTVGQVFGGLSFKANDLHTHHNVFPPGWTIIINTEDDEADHAPQRGQQDDVPQHTHIHRYKQPSLRNDHMFISSISNPSSQEFRAPTSPTRQIAMMLWATLYWYFHQQEPSPQLVTAASKDTPDAGKPKGEWRININREGIFKSKQLLPKLERMGLIASEDSSVGANPDNGVTGTVVEGWDNMFVSRRSFWQLDPRLYLFTLTPTPSSAPFPTLSPSGSRPASPNRSSMHPARSEEERHVQTVGQFRSSTPPGPFHSTSHLPTYYPPAPLQYTFTNNVRHPLRPKPARQGETIYMRYIPSLEQYLSFRVASLSKRPVPYNGPFSQAEGSLASARDILRGNQGTDSSSSSAQGSETMHMTDVELLHKWMNDPRVAYSWGEQGPQSHQEEFLKHGLTAKHAIPVIGCFDGKPFGFFEIYWVKEDRLGGYLGGDCGDFDRGIHVLVGEQEFRGPHRLRAWLHALVHYCWLADSRTNVVMLEPRVDNVKLRKYCEEAGFYKEREISFPHKQSNLMKIKREAWEAPAI